MPVHVCSVTNPDVNSNFTSHVLNSSDFYVKKLETIWITSSIAAIASITTVNW